MDLSFDIFKTSQLNLFCEILFVIFSIYFDLFCMKFLSDKTKSNIESPLFDYFHHITNPLYIKLNTKQLSIIKYCKDIMCYLPLFLSLLLCPIDFIWKYLKLYAITHLIRPLFFICTILPRSRYRHQINRISDCYNGGNHDLIFSGHSVGLYIASYAFYQYFASSGYYIAFLWYIYSFILSFIIIFLREHYTIDLLVSLLVTIILVK